MDYLTEQRGMCALRILTIEIQLFVTGERNNL